MGKLTKQMRLGSESFIEEHTHKKEEAYGNSPSRSFRPQQQIFDRRGENAIEVAYTDHGYWMREIAEHLITRP